MNWSPLDLVELGDLLVVMARSDLSRVKPNSLRLASSQLAFSTLFSTLLSEVRGHSAPVLYHEACGHLLDGQEGWSSQESIDMTSEWNALSNFMVLGSYLQVEVLTNGVNIPNQGSFKKDLLIRFPL